MEESHYMSVCVCVCVCMRACVRVSVCFVAEEDNSNTEQWLQEERLGYIRNPRSLMK